MIEFAQVAADNSLKDIVDWAFRLTMIALFGFVWRTQGIIVKLETLLANPDTGLLAQMKRMNERLDGTEEDTSVHSSRLDVHHQRLDGHDRELEVINEERRHHTRRASDRAREGAT